MLEITEKQWNDVKELYQSKLDEIKKLEEHIQYIERERERDRERLVSERISKHNENIQLKAEIQSMKNKKATDDASLKLVLETLNDALNTMERHGIKSKYKHTKITADNLLDEVV
jgi:predicted  nucleic acid-binding Zn-ribbon protein